MRTIKTSARRTVAGLLSGVILLALAPQLHAYQAGICDTENKCILRGVVDANARTEAQTISWVAGHWTIEGNNEYSLDWGPGFGQPFVGDWNNDGRLDLGVMIPFLQNTRALYLTYNIYDPTGTFNLVFNGTDGELVVGDWNGDGRDSVGDYNNGVFTLIMDVEFPTNRVTIDLSSIVPGQTAAIGGRLQVPAPVPVPTPGAPGAKPVVGPWGFAFGLDGATPKDLVGVITADRFTTVIDNVDAVHGSGNPGARMFMWSTFVEPWNMNWTPIVLPDDDEPSGHTGIVFAAPGALRGIYSCSGYEFYHNCSLDPDPVGGHSDVIPRYRIGP